MFDARNPALQEQLEEVDRTRGDCPRVLEGGSEQRAYRGLYGRWRR